MQYTHIYTCRHTNAKSFVPTISLAAVGPAVMPVIAVVVFTRGRLIRSDPIKHTRASGRFVPFVPLTTKPPRFYPRCVVETEDARVKRGYNRVLESRVRTAASPTTTAASTVLAQTLRASPGLKRSVSFRYFRFSRVLAGYLEVKHGTQVYRPLTRQA